MLAHLLLMLLLYLAHDIATTSGTLVLLANETIARALITFFTSSRHVLSAFSVSILDLKWLRKYQKRT